ncbi:MAG: ATP-binding protein [Candidatus Sulfopaludibacter sp.]|nr:ATP-binding protein [Candidatus Sulfopaludibacter sp.]
MFAFFRQLFSTEFMPHGMCYLWDPAVLWVNVISDALIAASYYAIPFLLFYFVRRRRDIAFKWIFVAFGMFILACGTTHLMGTVTVWHPIYRLDGVIKAVTAVASVATFAGLIPMMPTLISLPSPAALAREIEVRRAAEAHIRKINEELEVRVADRTASLEQALQDLRKEMLRRQELERELIQAQKMEAVGRLAGGIAHDFNNLLTVILGYDEILREHVKDDPTALEYASEISQASERAASLTNQLLAFSRRQVSSPRVTDLNALVRNIDKMLKRVIGEDLELETRLDPALARVKVDPAHIDQVILNLAVNSRDAMPQGGKLTIETANAEITEGYASGHIGIAPGHWVMLAVSDSGVGMDAATRERIFEPFFTTKEKGKGTGLGLSIVYGIVKQSGGEVLVYSEPGHGTVFKIYLPAAQAAEAAPAVTPHAPLEPAGATILLVEDEDQVRTLTRIILERLGYRVLVAATPAEALRIAGQAGENIDLLLTDIVMPLRYGTDLAADVQTLLPGIRVLFMSGYTDNSVVRQGLLSAGTAFIQKPFTARDLNRKVREILNE